MNADHFCDLRSDTVTHPTQEMLRAMVKAPLGDDVLGDDPTVKELEELAATVLGKERAMFFPSGTMANTAALMTYDCRLKELIVEEQSHIMNYENGNLSLLAGAVARPLSSSRGEIPVPAIASAFHPVEDDHQIRTAGICLENTHNYHSGAVLSLDYTRKVGAFAREKGIFLHLDGARLFNAAIFLKLPAEELAAPFSSVMCCLSKGLSAPVGSILAGDEYFIGKALKIRKILGGGMRQAGLLAACGIVALKTMPERLEEDHRKAAFLAEEIAGMKHLAIDRETIQTNIVIFSVNEQIISADELVAKLQQRNVLSFAFGPGRIRFVTHKDQNRKQLEYAVKTLQEVLAPL